MPTQPCPCGYYNHPDKECVCGPGVVQKYLNKISGPLLERIDLHVEVTPVPFKELSAIKSSEKSADVRERVIRARLIQEERFREQKDIHCNAQMTTKLMQQHCAIRVAGENLIKTAMEKLG